MSGQRDAPFLGDAYKGSDRLACWLGGEMLGNAHGGSLGDRTTIRCNRAISRFSGSTKQSLMRLRAKLTTAFLLIACIVWALGLVDLVFYIRSTRELRKITEHTTPTLVALDQLKINAFRMMLESIGVGLLRVHGNPKDGAVRAEVSMPFRANAKRLNGRS